MLSVFSSNIFVIIIFCRNPVSCLLMPWLLNLCPLSGNLSCWASVRTWGPQKTSRPVKLKDRCQSHAQSQWLPRSPVLNTVPIAKTLSISITLPKRLQVRILPRALAALRETRDLTVVCAAGQALVKCSVTKRSLQVHTGQERVERGCSGSWVRVRRRESEIPIPPMWMWEKCQMTPSDWITRENGFSPWLSNKVLSLPCFKYFFQIHFLYWKRRNCCFQVSKFCSFLQLQFLGGCLTGIRITSFFLSILIFNWH